MEFLFRCVPKVKVGLFGDVSSKGTWMGLSFGGV